MKDQKLLMFEEAIAPYIPKGETVIMIRGSEVITRREDGSISVGTVNLEPTLTRQEFKKDCDINEIVRKVAEGREITHLAKSEGMYADVSEIKDLQESLRKVELANAAFAALPGKVRERFEHDPQNLINFLQDSKNHDEGVALGLLDPKPIVSTPAPAPVLETPPTPKV